MHFFKRFYILLLLPLSLCAQPTRILTISDAIIDYTLFVGEEDLESLIGQKGGSCLVDHDTILAILKTQGESPLRTTGGSAVNILKGLASLGHPCSLIATVSEDEAGDFFLNHLNQHGVDLCLERSPAPTGKCVSLVTPSGERTMRTYLGGSQANATRQLEPQDFEDLDLFHIEGYQLQHRELIQKAVTLAKQAGARISMDLASFETTRAHASFIWELLHSGHIDVLFANKDEAHTLTDLDPEEACLKLATTCPTVVITLGEKGSIAARENTLHALPARTVSVIDTTGAGDLFMSGFLSSYLNDASLEECMQQGTLLASHVVQVVGSEIPPEHWEMINTQMH